MVNSQFSLTWDSYKSNICTGFSSLQQNGELVDMTLAAEGHFVKVHQVLIALSSPYLKQLILSAPCQHPVIFLNNMSHATLSLILEYIYTGEVIVPSANLTSFIEAAKALHIKGLENVADSGNKAAKMDIGMEDTVSTITGGKIDKLIPEQMKLPVSAKKIYLKQKSESNSPYGSKSQLWNVSTSDDIQNYSMDDNAQDSDDAYNDNTLETPKKRESALKSSNLQFTVSIRGSLQVILNRYIYNLHSTQSSGVRRWRCIDYRNKKCTAFVVTDGNIVMNRANPHNHSFHDKKILTKIENNGVFTALDDVQNFIDKDKPLHQQEPMESEFVSLALNSLTDSKDFDKNT